METSICWYLRVYGTGYMQLATFSNITFIFDGLFCFFFTSQIKYVRLYWARRSGRKGIFTGNILLLMNFDVISIEWKEYSIYRADAEKFFSFWRFLTFFPQFFKYLGLSILFSIIIINLNRNKLNIPLNISVSANFNIALLWLPNKITYKNYRSK